jgi:hypothetical protein
MTVEQWAAIVGFFLPALVSIVNRAEWKPWVKAVVALASAVLVGTVTALLSNSFDGTTWLQSIGIVFAASQVAYHTWWKGSEISSVIEDGVNVIAGKKQPELGGSPGDSGTGRHAADD